MYFKWQAQNNSSLPPLCSSITLSLSSLPYRIVKLTAKVVQVGVIVLDPQMEIGPKKRRCRLTSVRNTF